MPVTQSLVGGDGISLAAIRMNIATPDSYASIVVQGVYVPPFLAQVPPASQQTPIPFTGGTITTANYPNVPGSGSVSWICMLNPTTGAITTAQNATATPPAATAGTILLFSQVIPSGSPAAPTQWPAMVFPWLGCVAPN